MGYALRALEHGADEKGVLMSRTQPLGIHLPLAKAILPVGFSYTHPYNQLPFRTILKLMLETAS